MSTAPLSEEHRFRIVGTSPAAEALRASIISAASVRTHILISGESGVGKRYVAKQIHLSSSKSPGPFYEILPDTPEREVRAVLFGDDRKRVEGMIGRPLPVLNDEATVFVRDVHRFSMAGQSWIGLAMMQSSIGKLSPRFRVILAIPAPWSTLAKDRFISQSVAEVAKTSRHMMVPPLRERAEDIPAFIEEFVKVRALVSYPKVSEQTLRELSSYYWVDNVRELRHLVEEAMTTYPGDELILPTGFVDEVEAIRDTLGKIMSGKRVVLSKVLDTIEKSLIRRALLRTNFDKSKASSLLGLTDVVVGYRLKKHKFHHPDVRSSKSKSKVAIE